MSLSLSALVCFWKQALEKLCINIAFLLPVLGGPSVDICPKHRILSTSNKDNFILFIILNTTSFSHPLGTFILSVPKSGPLTCAGCVEGVREAPVGNWDS